MAVDVASFRARWGKPFELATDPEISKVLTEAAAQMNPRVWGDKYEIGQLLLAAHLLVVDRGGQFGRASAKSGVSSPYFERFEQMQSALLIGDRVI